MAENNNTTTTPTKSNPAIPARDAELMFRVIQNMKSKVSEVDWDQVAIDMGYKSGAVASTRFRQVRKSMETSFESPASASSGTDAATPTKGAKASPNKVTKTPRKPRTPRKGVAQPVKKGAKSTKSDAVVSKEEDSGVDDDINDDGDDDDGAAAAKLEEEDEVCDTKRKDDEVVGR